jgi:hypothetical protein
MGRNGGYLDRVFFGREASDGFVFYAGTENQTKVS